MFGDCAIDLNGSKRSFIAHEKPFVEIIVFRKLIIKSRSYLFHGNGERRKWKIDEKKIEINL